MYIDKKNYWLRLPIIDKFLKKIIKKIELRFIEFLRKTLVLMKILKL